jgi:hypothetical protein
MALHVFVIKETELEDPQDLRAESEKYSNSTNERKNMSTKTLRKRIALVAVSALGAGLLSVVAVPSANAADTGDFTFTGTGLLGSVITGGSTTQTATLLTTGSLVVTTTGGDNGYFVVSAGGSISSAVIGNGSLTAPDGISTDQKKFLTAGTTSTFTVVPTGAAGSTFTITGYTGIATGVVTDVLTVTIAASSSYGVASASSSYLSWVGTATAEATSDVANKSATDYATNALYLNVQINDAYGNNITSATGALVATVTAGATVGFGPITTCGTVVDPTATAGTYTQSVTATCPQSINLVVKQATVGAGWNGTVTVTYNGVTIGTKSGKITGAPASLLVSPVAINSPLSTTQTTWVYYVKDSVGNELTTVNATDVVLSTSSDSSVISAAVSLTKPNPLLTSSTYGYGDTTCAKAGSSKVVMQITTNGNVVKSNEFTQLCGGNAYSYTAAFDKASYVQGEIATMTVTFKDALGNLANSLVQVDACTYVGSITDAVISAPMMLRAASSSSIFEGDSTDSSCGIYLGKAGTKVYTFTVGTAVGLTDGSYNAVVSFPSVDDAAAVAYKVSTGSTGISLADVLKAIVSLIASINKQIAALQKALLKK